MKVEKNKPTEPVDTHHATLSCEEIREAGVLVDYITGTDSVLDHHLKACVECRQEYEWLARLAQESGMLAQQCEAVMDTIDWEENAVSICSQIPFNTAVPRVARGSVSGWYRAAAALFIVFALGIGLGYLLFRTPAPLQESISVKTEPVATLSLARLESSVTKREVTQYFQQCQLVLNDLLQSCDTRTSFSWQDHLDMKRVQVLLSKSRYFNQDLNNPDLLSSRPLLKKIQWLLYEIMMNDEDGSCAKLQKLQDYVRQERLLFKIHLVGKELSMSEV